MLMAVLLLTACAQSSRLKSIVESENATCPYELEEDVTVNSVELTDENTVTYYIELANHFDYLIDDEESKNIIYSCANIIAGTIAIATIITKVATFL